MNQNTDHPERRTGCGQSELADRGAARTAAGAGLAIVSGKAAVEAIGKVQRTELTTLFS